MQLVERVIELDLGDIGISDNGIASLAALTKLRRLNLQASNVTDAGLDALKNMTDLEELSLYRTKVSNAGLAKLSNLKKLRSIDLRYSRATNAGVKELVAGIPGVQIFFQDSSNRQATRATAVASVTDKGEAAIADWFRTTLITTPGRAPASKDPAKADAQFGVLALLDEADGPSKVAKQLDDARRGNPKATIFPEALVNLVGYEHLQSGNAAQAIAVFALNVSAFPASANAYDSLADGYLAAGKKDLARVNAQKALELLPSGSREIP